MTTHAAIKISHSTATLSDRKDLMVAYILAGSTCR